MKEIEIKIVNKSDNSIPKYQTIGSAGMDIRANLPKNNSMIINPGQGRMIPTGIYVNIPLGYMLNVHARSGLSYKNDIMVTNGVGIIDSDYRGECNVLLYNGGVDTFIVNNGDRIAQFVLQEVPIVKWNIVESLENSDRGTGGFGSTGIE